MVTKSRLEGIEFKYQADEDTFRALQDSFESNLAKYGEDYALTISSGENICFTASFTYQGTKQLTTANENDINNSNNNKVMRRFSRQNIPKTSN